MRQIQFRAWDIDNNMFFDCSSHLISQISNDYSGLGNRFIYQQFTGLQDKNGKDIYEGDIIDGLDIDTNFGQTYKNIKVSFRLGEFGIGGGAWHLGLKYLSEIEVIGNIYENPELIKE